MADAINPQLRQEPVNFFPDPDPVASREQQVSPDFVSTFMEMDIEEQSKLLLDDEVGNPIFKKITDPIERTKFLNDINEDKLMIASLFDLGRIPPGTPEYTAAQQIYLKAKPFIKPAAEVTAMTGGGIMGAPVAPPFGSIGGAGLGYGMVQNIFKITEALLGLREPQGIVREAQEAVADIQEGAAFEMGGQVLGPVVKSGKEIIKKPFEALTKKSTLTTAGAKQRAKDIIKKEIKGTEITQPQIDENVRLAKELQAKIRKEIEPDFTFTMGQLTDDASAVALERTLARREGLDLTQSQRQHAVESLRTYYNKKVLSTGTTEDFIAYTDRLSKELGAATKEATKAVESEVTRLGRHIDPQLIGTNIFTKLSAGRRKMSKKVGKLFDQIPNFKIKPSAFIQKMKEISASALRDEPKGDFPTEAFKFINAQIRPSGGAGSAVSDITVQQLRGINRTLNNAIKKASTEGNGVLGHRLRQLKDAVTESINITIKRGSTDKKGMKVLQKANAMRTSMDARFDKSAVGDVLSRGARGEETRIAKANIAQAFDSLDGIDDLIRATNSVPVAKSMMKDYYSFQLTNTAVDAEGIVSAKKALTWLAKNRLKLKKLGLLDNFNRLGKLQSTVDDAIKNKDVFNKSVAGRVLQADIDNVIANAYAGSKNLPQTTRELLELTKGNKEATQGMKKAFADFLINKVESRVPKFFQSISGTSPADVKFLESMSKMNAMYKQFRSSYRIMFKDEPVKLQAIEDMWQGFRIIERTARSPVGAGSPTAELIFGERAIARTGAAALGGVRPGWLYPFIFINKWIEKHGQRNVEAYLTRAMFDPDYAAIMTKEVKTGKVNMPTVRRLMRNAALLTTDFPEKISKKLDKQVPVGTTPPVK